MINIEHCWKPKTVRTVNIFSFSCFRPRPDRLKFSASWTRLARYLPGPCNYLSLYRFNHVKTMWKVLWWIIYDKCLSTLNVYILNNNRDLTKCHITGVNGETVPQSKFRLQDSCIHYSMGMETGKWVLQNLYLTLK